MTPYNIIFLSDYDRIPSFLARIVDGRMPAPRATACYKYEDTGAHISITESDTRYGSGEFSVYGPMSLLRRAPQGGRV